MAESTNHRQILEASHAPTDHPKPRQKPTSIRSRYETTSFGMFMAESNSTFGAKDLTLDKRRMSALDSTSVGVFLAVVVPFFALSWFLCGCVREAKRSWAYIEVE
jgi:hypothetical protein